MERGTWFKHGNNVEKRGRGEINVVMERDWKAAACSGWDKTSYELVGRSRCRLYLMDRKGEAERETERQTDRQTEKQRETERDTETERV